MIILLIPLLFFTPAFDADWRDGFPYLYAYDYLVPEKEIYNYFAYESDHKDKVKLVISDWAKLNPQLEFIQVSSLDNAHISFDWATQLPNGDLGYTDTHYFEDGHYSDILIDVEFQNCPYSEFIITNTISHELGHALGIEHSTDENHLMFGDDGIQNFNEVGLKIPEIVIPENADPNLCLNN